MYRCKCCNSESYRNLDKTGELCGVCYSASMEEFVYSRDHEFADIEGSGYTKTDSIKHHLSKNSTMCN